MIKSISIPDGVARRAVIFAERNGQTFSGLVRISVEQYLRDAGVGSARNQKEGGMP